MPDRKRIAEYFLVVGLPPENPQPLEMHRMEEDEDIAANGSLHLDPITDIAIVNANEGELPPRFYSVIKTTPKGNTADLNGDSFSAPAMYLCVKRGRDKPPLTEIGVYYHPKDGATPAGHDVVRKTPYGRPANVSNSSSLEVYLTYKRASPTAAANCPVITDVCVILGSKEECPPHAFIKVDKNLNKALLSASVFVCYKSSRVRHHQLAYTASILSRYPTVNHPECPLSESVPLFGLPTGAVLEAWPARNDFPQPECSTFVLTDAEGVKLYGSSLSFYEAYDRARLTEEQSSALELDLEAYRKLDLRVFSNKAIVILSLFPFFDAFKSFLQFLHARIHWTATSEPSAMEVPLEKYVLHFLHEVHCPSPHMPNIELSLHDTTITLRMIEETLNISQGGASFVYLLSDLGADNAISLLMHTLTEQKLLVHSLRQDRLTRVCEAIISIVFPLQWQCAYIPLCPLELSGLLHAPVPFIYGFDSRYFDFNRHPPDDVICVDLDAKILHVPTDRKFLAHKLLPKKPLKVLKTSLEERLVRIREFEQRCAARSRVSSFDVTLNRLENEIETSIKECFLRFMACLLRDYRAFLVPINPSSSQLSATDSFSLFDVDGYQRSKERAYHKFYSLLLRTQMFSRFIEENSLGSSGRDESLAFFESCTQLVDEGRDTPRLLERDKAVASEYTKLILPPEPLDPGQVFAYNGVFPCLDEELMRQMEPGESAYLAEGGDTDSGIAGTGSTASAAAPASGGGPRDGSGSGSTLDDSAPAPHPPAGGPAAEAGQGTPRSVSLAGSGPAGDAGRQRPAWLRIKHEQTVTNRIGRCTLASKARDKVWPCHLLSAAYCLWFPLLPAYLHFRASVRSAGSPADVPSSDPGLTAAAEVEVVLRYALDLVNRMLELRVIPVDQVCYRVLLQMAAAHRLPQLAMDVLAGMRVGGVPANAVTYALYNQVLLELGVVSDSIDPGGVRSAMKRSLSDDGQLDGRSPRAARAGHDHEAAPVPSADQRRPRGLSSDAGADRGALREVGASVDSAVSELKEFVAEQSTRAMRYQKVVRSRLVRSIWTMVNQKSKAEGQTGKEKKAEEVPNGSAPVDAPEPSPCDRELTPPSPTEPPASSPHPPPRQPEPLPQLVEPEVPEEAEQCAEAETAPGPETAEPTQATAEAAEAAEERTESPKSLPIVRRPKRPSIIRNRSLTADDRRRTSTVVQERSRDFDEATESLYLLYSVDAGLLTSMTPTPGSDAVFSLPPPAAPGPAQAGAGMGPLAESTPLTVDVAAVMAQAGAEPGPPADVDRTPMPSGSGAEPPTPTPQSAAASSDGTGPAASAPPRRTPVRNLQSLFVEKSELHISFMGPGSGRERRTSKSRAGQAACASGSTFSVDSRMSTETEEDAEEAEEETSTEDEEDQSGLLTFFQLARRAGLTSRLSARPGPAPAVGAPPARSSTLSLAQEADASSLTSRGSADNALAAVSNFRRHASTRLKDAATRFSQKMASMRLQLNPALPVTGAGAGGAGQLNRSAGELCSNSYVGAGAAGPPAVGQNSANWLSASMRKWRQSQDSSLGVGGGSMGEESDDEDSDSSTTTCTLRDVWKHLSGVSMATSPLSSRPSVGSTPTSPVDEAIPGPRRTAPPLLLLRLTSCSACVQCHALIYDEDIMNGWTHEASNLNTQCPYCASHTLPRLTISLGVEGPDGGRGPEEHMTTLYLSPLALRQVMETVFLAESPFCLQQIGVIEAHPELFWNCLWYLTRLHLPNHLLHLVGLWWSSRHGRGQAYRVRVEFKWDSWVLEESRLKPLYRIWVEKADCHETDPMHPVVKHMERILNHIKRTDMNEALRLFLEERHVKVTDRSAFREILYLCILALGRNTINIESFTFYYAEAFRMAVERGEVLEPCDKPPDRGVTWCRTMFPVLDL